MRLAWLALFIVACAPSNNPCDGQPAICVAVEVDGPFHDLDALDGLISAPYQAALMGGTEGAIHLPVQFAALLPADFLGALLVEVLGLQGSSTVAYGRVVVVVPPSGQRVQVQLGPLVEGDDLARVQPPLDLAANQPSVDLASSDLSGSVDAAGDLGPVACDPISQQPCAADQKCVTTIAYGYVCVPNGTLATGALCNSGSDECVRGDRCAESMKQGICTAYCSSDSDCPTGTVASGETAEPNNFSKCVPTNENSNYCSLPCNPILAAGATGCPPGFSCFYFVTSANVEYTICGWSSTSTTSCTKNEDCANGYGCVDDRCFQLCRIGFDSDCPSTFQCLALVNAVTHPMFGICCASTGC